MRQQTKHLGVEVLDQALQGARAILNGNEHSALLILAPLAAGKSEQLSELQKRRLIEDKLQARLWLLIREFQLVLEVM